MTGNVEPYGRPVAGSIDAGPVDPWQPAEHVGADDEVAVGVDGQPGPDDALPPTRGRMAAAGRSGQVAVAGPRVADQHRVGGRRRPARPTSRRRWRRRRAGHRGRARTDGRPRSVRNRRRPGSSPGRHAPLAGYGVAVDHRLLLSWSVLVGLANMFIGASRERKRSLPGSPLGRPDHISTARTWAARREAPWGFRPRLPDLGPPAGSGRGHS